MVSDETEIRQLIERWVAAVNDGDLETVARDHADDIVMFDVPPPYRGVRGLDAYRASWRPFFEWLATGAVFEIQTIDVVAGTDVALAYGLLQCGTPEDFARRPGVLLRLTIGLEKRGGRWTVVHEHHSFPHDDDPADGRPAN